MAQRLVLSRQSYRTLNAFRSGAERFCCLTGTSLTHRRSISIQQLDEQRQGRERVVILGSGWAGYGLSRSLDPRKHQVVVVSPRSYFVFTPLLAGTSTGTLEFRTAIEPVRARGRQQSQIQYFQGWADSIDLNSKKLTIESAVGDPLTSRALVSTTSEHAVAPSKKGKTFDLSWDKLVIAVGCYAETFNTKGVKENAYFLKDVGDARAIRRQTLDAFEAASLPTTHPDVKKALLNFAVVGGGPTGIEWAAEMHDFIAEDLSRLYPDIWKLAKVTVYDVAPTVLSMFDERLSKYAMKTFQRQGIEIKTSHHVQELRKGLPEHLQKLQTSEEDKQRGYTITLQEEGEVPIGMCVWSTGLMMNPLVEKLSSNVKQHSKTHAILTDDRMRVMGSNGSTYDDIFAIGDCANIEGTNYPATAQVASQKASWLGKHLRKGDLDKAAFTYRDLGVMAYTGAGSAILQSKGGDISGFAAWLIWRGVYLTKSVSWRNKVLIPIYWSVNWLFGRDVSRF